MVPSEESLRAFGDRYRLLEFVGEGSSARVYLAEDLTLHRHVAFKILRAETADDESFRECFAEEIRATSALNHPRVLPVHDWGLDPQPYIVTEYLAGGSLAALLSAGHRLTPSQALVVGLEAARALVNIHAGGRAHLGLGPTSILFDSAARPYVSDLGLSAALAATASHPADTGDADAPEGVEVIAERGDEAQSESGEVIAERGDEVQSESVEVIAERGDEAQSESVEVIAERGDEVQSESVEVIAERADEAHSESGEGAGTNEPVAPADRSNEQGSVPRSYSRLEQAQDVHDLALVLCEAVTGVRILPSGGDDASMASMRALGPLQAVLERAIAADPAERLSAAALAEELLGVAALLPRPDPIPLAAEHRIPTASPAAPLDQADDFRQVGPSVSERSAVPLDDARRRRWPGIVLAAVLVLGGAVAGTWALFVSGSDTVAVPDLEGQTRTAAAAAIAAADLGWEVNEILVREPGTRRGQVVRTEPPAGAPLGEGASLDVFVSLGAPLIPVSDLGFLYGMTVSDATDELEARGLAAGGETLVNDAVVPPGLVVGLDVGEGVYELKVGAEVDLLVSDGLSEAG